LRALERVQVPYDVVEASSATSLEQYRLLILPWPMIVDAALVPRLVGWVRAGGTLLTEASLDAFNDLGLFKYPSERHATIALGLHFSARKPLNDTAFAFEIGGRAGRLLPARWREEISSVDGAAGHSIRSHTLGKGHVIAVGSFIGLAYWEQRYADFESFLTALVDASRAQPALRCSADDGEIVQWRLGASAGVPLLFVINHGAAVDAQFVATDRRLMELRSAVDLAGDTAVTVVPEQSCLRLRMQLSERGYHIIRLTRQTGLGERDHV
jgi:beta-galactosidase